MKHIKDSNKKKKILNKNHKPLTSNQNVQKNVLMRINAKNNKNDCFINSKYDAFTNL